MDLKRKTPGAINTEGSFQTIDLDSSCQSIEGNVESQDHAQSWLWCASCKCLTNSELFTTCSQCGRSGDQIKAVDEVAGRKLLEVAS